VHTPDCTQNWPSHVVPAGHDGLEVVASQVGHRLGCGPPGLLNAVRHRKAPSFGSNAQSSSQLQSSWQINSDGSPGSLKSIFVKQLGHTQVPLPASHSPPGKTLAQSLLLQHSFAHVVGGSLGVALGAELGEALGMLLGAPVGKLLGDKLGFELGK